MKLFKKAALLCLSLLTCFSATFAIAACKDNDDTGASNPNSSVDSSVENDDNASYVYRVSVQNATGFGFPGVTVTLMDGDKEIASKKTNAAGNANFKNEDISTLNAYMVALSDLPDGYVVEESANLITSPNAGTQVIAKINPTGVIQGTRPENKGYYQLGDVMYDFTVTTSDNSTVTLSEILKEKDMLLLNFWATWCAPCKMEFPAMQNAYAEYIDQVSVLAVSTTDDKNSVAAFKQSSGLTFDMASNNQGGANLANLFDLSMGIPTTVLIDRYGVVAYKHTGSITSKSGFTVTFDKFVGDEYVPTILGINHEDTEEEEDEDIRVLPNVNAPTMSEVNAILGTNATYRWQDEDPTKYDEYSWPWIVDTTDNSLKTPTSNLHSSYAILYADFTAKANDVLCFDYYLESESDGDYLYVMIDGVIIHELSGYQVGTQWKTCYAYVFKEYEAGEHELALVYLKDSSGSAGEDMAKIKSLRFTTTEDSNLDTNIFRYAATVYNTDENATTQFKHYITPVFNETDGYYHVGAKDGPLLFANIMYATQWNATSLWVLAYNNYCIADGINFGVSDDVQEVGIIEQYAWEASHNFVNNGYTPVTEDLRYWLETATEKISYGQLWNGEWHENEWLELCVYYEHYGNSPQMADPLKNITFHAATEITEGTNTVEVPFAMTPRGFKYKFIPTQSGVYNVYSVGNSDTVCFLIASDRTTMLGEWDDIVAATIKQDENGVEIADGNFNFHVYLNAGETYYLLFTTFLDAVATYDVVISYTGASYTFLDNCATGPMSFNEVTQENFLPDAIKTQYSEEDGYYHYVNEDGTLGSVIYLDTQRPTALFNSDSLQSICDNANKYATEKRAFYINGKDYTADFQKYCWLSKQNTGDLQGFIAVDKEVFALLQILMIKYGSVEDSWQLLCYYYTTIDAENPIK
ncbi:MAG: TlpA family protein disulfide reductase [Clostridiales bacterium]|nr:TlpA family protein disulfide reductase [Clostridiales bacterium]